MNNSSTLIIMLIAIILIGVAIMVIMAVSHGRGRVLDQEKYRTAWLEIENNISNDNEASYQFAILSADKLLDRALRELGVAGRTMGERLKHSNSRFSDINGIWAAHKLRNRIAHEVDGYVKRPIAKRMLAIYKKSLKELGAI